MQHNCRSQDTTITGTFEHYAAEWIQSKSLHRNLLQNLSSPIQGKERKQGIRHPIQKRRLVSKAENWEN